MIYFWAMFSLAVAWAIGLGLMTCALRTPLRTLARDGFVSPLSLGLGLGICSATYFVALFAGFDDPVQLPAREIALAILSITAGQLILHHQQKVPSDTGASSDWLGGRSESREPAASLRWARAVPLAAVAMGLMAIAIIFFQHANLPMGGWDAWAFWLPKARFVHAGGDAWSAIFEPVISHPDYPAHMPFTVARYWVWSGQTSTMAPLLNGLVYTLLTTVTLYAALKRLRGSALASIGVVTLLGFPFFVMHGASLYAEPALAFHMLAAVVLLTMALHAQKHRNACLLLAGAFVGLAAWTKNEGQAFTAAYIVFGLAPAAWFLRKDRPLSAIGMSCVGLIIGLLPLLIQKFGMPEVEGKVIGMVQERSVWGQLTDWEHHGQMFLALWVKLFRYPQHAVVWLLILGLIVSAAAMPKRFGLQLRQPAHAVALLIALGTTGAFYGAMLWSEANLWTAAVIRLCYDAWVLVVFALLLLTPEADLSADTQARFREYTPKVFGILIIVAALIAIVDLFVAVKIDRHLMPSPAPGRGLYTNIYSPPKSWDQQNRMLSEFQDFARQVPDVRDVSLREEGRSLPPAMEQMLRGALTPRRMHTEGSLAPVVIIVFDGHPERLRSYMADGYRLTSEKEGYVVLVRADANQRPGHGPQVD